MGVSPQELEANNGSFVELVDFTGQVYQGVLHYEPIKDPQFPIQLWSDSCCFITFISPDDVDKFYPNPTPCLIKQDCCVECPPSAFLLNINAESMACACLNDASYVLEWNTTKAKYEFDYPGICNCASFHAELICTNGKWVVYLAIKNEMGFTCADGNHLDFPLDCAIMSGTAVIDFTPTGTCACGPCSNSRLTVTLSPV